MAAIQMVECDGCKKRIQPSTEDMKGWLIVVIHRTFEGSDVVQMQPIDFCSFECMKENIRFEQLVAVVEEKEPQTESPDVETPGGR